MTGYSTDQQEHGQDLNIGVIVTTGLAFALLTIVAVMYLYGLYLRTEHSELDRKAAGLADEYFKLRQAQLEELATYGWVDQPAGIARLPIDEAIRQTAAKLGGSAPAPTESAAPGGTNGEDRGQHGNEHEPSAGGGGAAPSGRPGE